MNEFVGIEPWISFVKRHGGLNTHIKIPITNELGEKDNKSVHGPELGSLAELPDFLLGFQIETTFGYRRR